MDAKLVGIVNCTPDSFSDGGNFLKPEDAINQGKKLIDDGADILDIGGDSTRPGSVCVGPEEEWKRIKDAVKELSKLSRISVDTHHAEVARRAFHEGATIINDISAGYDEEMFSVIAMTGMKYVMMYSRCSSPHLFDYPDLTLDEISQFLKNKVELAIQHGVAERQIIIDPGMGGFVSKDFTRSLDILSSISKIMPTFPLLLGISRKGFLNRWAESMTERDWLSAIIGINTVFSEKREVFLRVHNVRVHKIISMIYDQLER